MIFKTRKDDLKNAQDQAKTLVSVIRFAFIFPLFFLRPEGPIISEEKTHYNKIRKQLKINVNQKFAMSGGVFVVSDLKGTSKKQ